MKEDCKHVYRLFEGTFCKACGREIPETEMRARLLGTKSVLLLLESRQEKKALMANSVLRNCLHDKPLPGSYIRKGRKKLAFNLRDIPEPKSQAAISLDFKKARTRRILD